MRKLSKVSLVLRELLIALGLNMIAEAWTQQPAPAPQASAAQAGAKPEEGKKPEEAKKPEEEKAFDEVVKDMEVKRGLFTFYRKADENKVLMEILPQQLDKTFLFAGTIDQGTGERGLYASMVAGDFPFLFRRVGKNILWVEKNTNFIAASQTPAARFTARSFTDAILGSAKIQSKPQPERKSVLIDVSEMFVSDLPGFAIGLNQVYQPSSYKFDKDHSAIGEVKSFPENASSK